MRILRALFVTLFTAFVACLLAFFAGDYLTRLGHMSDMEGGRGMFDVFVCAPLGILVGLATGIISSVLVRRQGTAGFLLRKVGLYWLFAASPACWQAFHIYCRINLPESLASASNCNSNCAHRQPSKYQTSLTVTISGLAFTRIISRTSTRLSTGARSRKTRYMPRSPAMWRC